MTTVEHVNLIEQLRTAQGNFDKSLVLIRALKNCEISLQEIELVEGGWRIVPLPVEVPPAIAERMNAVEAAEKNGAGKAE